MFVEPVQGEGGIFPADKAFLQGLKDICEGAGAVLIFDEVQCGLGRTGYLWGHQSVDVAPDIMTVAKPLAGGLPIGAILCTRTWRTPWRPATTGPRSRADPWCAAANAVFDKVSDEKFLANVTARASSSGADCARL